MRALRRLAVAAAIVCSLGAANSASADKYCIDIPLAGNASSVPLPAQETNDSERTLLGGPICVDLP